MAGVARAEVVTALTSTNTLVTFNSATPGTLIGGAVTITGLTAGDLLQGIDYRPIDQQLIGFGYNTTTGNAAVYSINSTTGAATRVNSGLAIGTGASRVTADF